jgi:hypothetical protein
MRVDFRLNTHTSHRLLCANVDYVLLGSSHLPPGITVTYLRYPCRALATISRAPRALLNGELKTLPASSKARIMYHPILIAKTN